ncbi:MAG: aromatic ring-hydroxylating dioxygenase subunit alpha [Dehalococcoidia bacterium]|nr:aromatic ring-hydroxylating dioxygenase subunit alpha [Dehalococcoidia bacterium]
MLPAHDNTYITRTGPGTPMGNLLRRFWAPVLLSSELPGPDCPPVQLRVMSEDLVAFRTTSGRPAVLAAHCPHRGASLFFGRNEEEGLRCVYHGWKFDATGRCIDMPNEPPESNPSTGHFGAAQGNLRTSPSAELRTSFRDKVHHTAYQCREQAGIIWVYLGPPDLQAELPQLEWAALPPSHIVVSKRLQDCNYLQAMEGGIDPSHLSFLHSKKEASQKPVEAGGIRFPPYMTRDRHPRFETLETGSGVQIAARRVADDEHFYWRISQFLLPWYTIFPADPGLPLGGHAWVPIDDTHCWTWSFSWQAERPLTPEEVADMRSGLGIHAHVDPITFQPLANRANDYRVDRVEQHRGSFSGIRGIGEQDMAAQESMGPIYDRTKEHLGVSDAAIISMRRLLLRLAHALEAGQEPAAAAQPENYRVRSAALVLPRAQPWQQGAAGALASPVFT